MRAPSSLIALTLAAGAAAEAPPPAGPMIRVPAPDALAASPEGWVRCRDTIHLVREERGLPREAPALEAPQMIAAVDHRIDGCSVMVMHRNTSDVRPVPTTPDGPPRLQRIPR